MTLGQIYLKATIKMNEVQTNILNVVGNEQNQRRRKKRNVMLFGVPASKAAELQIKEDQEIVKEIFSEIGLSQDTVSMVSLTRIKPNPSRTTTSPPPLRMTLIDFSYSYRSIEDVLSATKQLKGSVKFNSLYK